MYYCDTIKFQNITPDNTALSMHIQINWIIIINIVPLFFR